MADAPSRARAFDAILIARPASVAALAGLSLFERAAFTLARAGARRLLCIGERPGSTRIPDVPATYAASGADPALPAWIAAAAEAVIGMDAAAVVDHETIIALAADSHAGILAVDGGTALWRAPAASVASVLPQALAHAAAAHMATAIHPDARGWALPACGVLIVVDDEPAARAASDALFARLGRPGDGWFTRLIDRRISRALTRLLLPTGVTPNQVTLASIGVGITGALLFAIGTHVAAVAGALLFLASTIVDGCDGELARLTFRESAFGARLDVIGDNIVHLFLFGGIAVGLFRQHHDPRIAVAGWLLMGGVLASMAAVYTCIVRRQPTPRQRALFEAFASREFAYVLMVLTIAGKLEWFLWASAVGTYAFVGGLLALRR